MCGSSRRRIRIWRRWCSEGKFRDDLFFRLNVVKITMPPLRERKEDIPLLVNAFLKALRQGEWQSRSANLPRTPCKPSSPYDWPGNVRELRTAIEHGVVMATGPKITLRDLPVNVRLAVSNGGKGLYSPASVQPYNLEETGQRLIDRALTESKGNITEAARKLGISRRTLHRKLKSMREKDNSEEMPPDDTRPAGGVNREGLGGTARSGLQGGSI